MSEASDPKNRNEPQDSLREHMIQDQIIARGIVEPRLLAAFRKVPRHLFVPADVATLAYTDQALPIGFGQTISQPYTAAKTIEALRLTGTERVLDVGTGSGYAAAILSYLVPVVYSVERIDALGQQAFDRFRELGILNIHVHITDGSKGLAGFAPYDAILVSAGASELPEALVSQLSPLGRIVIPVGSSKEYQSLMRYSRVDTNLRSEKLGCFSFVPLIADAK